MKILGIDPGLRTTGFGVIFRDARVIIDDSLDVGTNDFPSWMEPTI